MNKGDMIPLDEPGYYAIVVLWGLEGRRKTVILDVYEPRGTCIETIKGYSQTNATDRAYRKAEKHRAASKKAKRECMTCGQEFISDGPQNRMCENCNRHASNGGML